jgi:hypothetical protein
MNIIRLSLFVSALALLGGCVGVPVAPGHYTGSLHYYDPAPMYYAPPIWDFGRPPVHVNPRINIRPRIGGGDHGGKRDSARGPGRGSGSNSVRGSHRGSASDSARGSDRDADRDSRRGPGRGPARR